MLLVALGVGLPFLLPLLLWLTKRWTDRRGWTRVAGRERAMFGTALQGWNLVANPELARAVEYRKVCHDEEEGQGKKRRPHFPGVGHGRLRIRALQDTPAALAQFSAWVAMDGDLAGVREAYLVNLPLSEVACLVEANGEPAGVLVFGRLTPEPGPGGAYSIHSMHGTGDAWSGAPDSAVLRLLLSYLLEMEAAGRVLLDLGPEGIVEVTPDLFGAQRVDYFLLLRS